MTRKDFQLIADAISELNNYDGDDAYSYIANVFADRLADTNPRFDRNRFLEACGVPHGEVK